MCRKAKGLSASHSQIVGAVTPVPGAAETPDEAVLCFVEGELKASGRLGGISAMAWLLRLGGGVTEAQKAGWRLALAMYGERVDPSARDLIRQAIAA